MNFENMHTYYIVLFLLHITYLVQTTSILNCINLISFINYCYLIIYL